MTSSSKNLDLTPESVKKEAKAVIENLLPPISKERYLNNFVIDLYEEGSSLYMAGTHKQFMKRKLMKMMVDLIFDAKAKIQAVRFIREQYRIYEGYQFGGAIYDIRRKYARMLVIHKNLLLKIKNTEEDSYLYNPLMVEAVHLGIDIDHRVQALEETEYFPYRFPPNVTYNKITTRRRRKAKKSKLRYRRVGERLQNLYSLNRRMWDQTTSEYHNQAMIDKHFKSKEYEGEKKYIGNLSLPSINMLKKNLDGLAFDSDLD